jgi:hypothetical protein
MDQFDPIAKLVEVRVTRRAAPHHAEDVVPAVEQQFCEQGAVLPADARDQRACAQDERSGAFRARCAGWITGKA